MNSKKLTIKHIRDSYKKLEKFYKNYLKKHGVTLPSLKQKNKYTKDVLVLVYLSQFYPNTKTVSKEELTHFIRRYYPNTNDVQQARHLSAQKGWSILSGGRDNIRHSLKRGEYKLDTLTKPYYGFKDSRRGNVSDWNALKKKYSNRCATCGSKEGQPHFHWPSTKTKLQKSHKDPSKKINDRNAIPQCQKCNQADRNRWVYDSKGRVVKVANPKVLKSCSVKVQKEVYHILYNKFKGCPPEDLNR